MRWGQHRYGHSHCVAPGCDRADIQGRGYCSMHYCRWRRHGTIEAQPPVNEGVCTVADCGMPRHKRGMCCAHYNRWLRRGNTDPCFSVICQVEGCNRTDMAGYGFCTMHYWRWRRATRDLRIATAAGRWETTS